jgi:hypothetical protein
MFKSIFFQLALHFVLTTILPVMYIGSSADLREDASSILNLFASVGNR